MKWSWPLCPLLLLSYLCAHFIVTDAVSAGPSPDFSRHRLIKPKIYHGREKRQISTTLHEDGHHIHDLTIGYVIDDQEHILDLRLNRELIPADFFIKYQHNGKHVINKPTGKDLDLCQYVGVVRDLKGSWAAISTCRGLRGVVYDGKVMHYLQSGDDENLESHHYFYSHNDLISNHTCGFIGDTHPSNRTDHNHHHSTVDSFVPVKNTKEFNRILRYKRSASSSEPSLRGPYNANKNSRYVELLLVIDNKEYKELGEKLDSVHHHSKDIANIINSLYAPLNIFIALVGVIVWTESDEISLSSDGDTTLQNFLHYRRETLVQHHPNDNAQLLTRVQFTGGVVGKALKGPICTFEFSGGVAMDHSNVVGLVATTVAHEMGHNFGMEHDTEDCVCPDERCIMSPSSTSLSPTHWSSCSLEYLALAFEHGMDYCLRNKPKKLFDSPVCGNGFVEPGEQCDCGLSSTCANNHCCNPATCMLYPNATCATGECCDLQTCRPSTAGTECRSANQECDLPEYCTGQSEFCPEDIFKMDTAPCDNGKAYCYQGSCRTRTDQCKLLWGPSGKTSDDQCYDMNKKGSRHGNCGYNKLKQQFSMCRDENIFCGMLHCRHLNEKLEFGMETVSILSHSFINNQGSIIPCRTAIVDLGLNQMDPGLVPDGAKCGEGKMCVNQTCMSVESLRLSGARSGSRDACPSDCSGHGVCNSLGHCHCDNGFAPPLCDLPGSGGSLDSGPATDPNAQKQVTKILLVFFLGVVPAILLAMFFIYYSRRNSIFFWRKPKGSSSKSPTKNTIQRRLSQGASCLGLCSPTSSVPTTISQSSPRMSPDDMNSSLLSPSQTNAQPQSFQNSFFGHFKGFSLAPIPSETNQGNQNYNDQALPNSNSTSSFKKPPTPTTNNVKNIAATINRNSSLNNRVNSPPQSPQKVPQRMAPPVPTVPTVTIKMPSVHRNNTQKISEDKQSNNTAMNKPKSIASGVENVNSTSIAPALPPLNQNQQNARPTISSPILETSMCTAKELISTLKPNASTATETIQPTRAAPAVPVPKDKRPLSSPNAVVNIEDTPLPKKPKEGYNTLTRIASFLKQDKKDDEKARNPVERSNSLSKNQIKAVKSIDKNALRNLQISNPIPQSEIEIPSNAVPVVSDSEDCDNSKSVMMRAQSMRGTNPNPKPNIPTFGSMRQAPGTKRPTSIPTGVRPKSPPPPRPDKLPEKIADKLADKFNKIPGLPGYQSPNSKNPEYDDCVPETHAPLGNIVEETTPDNIYSVIEESPPKTKLVSKPSLISEYNSPKPVTNIHSTSSESMGLLGEIVSEIQHMNFDSIYSTSTLARKKKEKEEKEKKGTVYCDEETDFDNVYANTPHYKSPENGEYSNMNGGAKSISSAASTTSSGYLSPSVVNAPMGEIPLNSGIVSVGPTKFEGYKPYSSSLHRSLGPFASSYSKDTNKTDSSATDATSKLPLSNLSRQITPPSLKSTSKFGNGLTKVSPPGSKVNSPDVVSSCAPPAVNGVKSPDVVISNDQSKESGMAQGVVLRPTLPTSMSVKPVTQQKPTIPKVSIKQPGKPDTKPPVLRSAPAPPDKKKIVPPRPTPPKFNSSGSSSGLSSKSNSVEKNLSNLGSVNSKSASSSDKKQSSMKPSESLTKLSKPNIPKSSNVANLQQKFENSKTSSVAKTSGAKRT